MTAKAELADSHERLWAQVQRLTNELYVANETIRKLTGGQELEAVKTVTPEKPLEPSVSVGIVQCPKCGQLMEVMK